jgi:nitrite reductase (cytochrome c-552)
LGEAKPGTCMTCKSSHVPTLLDEMGPKAFYGTPMKRLVAERGIVHPVSCADCHDGSTMDLKITRPAFADAMARRGVDLVKASRQEMRTYVCAQCHVEYYFAKPGDVLVFPWDRGLRVDDIEKYYDENGYSDWIHAETGASMIKMQHPEFELWSTGVHARAGISCSDCHMPYVREGALKITDHWIRTPLANLSNACLPCHRQTETEMRSRVLEIQDRTYHLLGRAERAILSAMDAVIESRKAGGAPEEALRLLRSAQLRWDYVSAENSMGFHSPQEAARVLGDAIDMARQAEISVLRIRKNGPDR